ncbi:MAG: hypothetical protein JSW48_05145 [Betaproteobacteria bacterium]|jgi:hypothetical protein|nr:MAG: hypothetical protein JSW48_05145 [Betaproteobacteria bacterium]
MFRFKQAATLATAALLWAASGYAQNSEIATIADANGCKVYNPMPQEEESISWTGECRDGFAHGQGVLDWFIDDRLEERYEGELKMGWADGEGTYVSRRGVRYKGEWKNSLQDGNGTIQNPDGSIYKGEWKEGKPHGRGTYRSPNGDTVEGEWVDGELRSESDSRRI